jgi:maltose alpha-D-glucosyltransferase/alpha-amylase
VRYLSAEQSNSSVVIGNSLVLKLIRKVASGVHPELEMSAYLTEAGFSNISPLLGAVIRRVANGRRQPADDRPGLSEQSGRCLGMDAEQPRTRAARRMADAMSEQEQHYNALGELKDFAGMLGQRLGEMHQVLAPDRQSGLQDRGHQRQGHARHRPRMSRRKSSTRLNLLKQHREPWNAGIKTGQ